MLPSPFSRSTSRPSIGGGPAPYQPSSPTGSGVVTTMITPSSGPRAPSTGLTRPPPRSIVPDKQLSQIEKSVTHLLVATKQLLETLTQWSRQQATETAVSDVYVRLGYEFNMACRAFGVIGVDTTDLGPVPDLLRTILEDTLSQDASPQSLDRYLPRIRDIIINLLHGLKKKQARLRSRQARDDSRALSGRQTSTGSVASSETVISQTSVDSRSTLSQSPPKRPPNRRYGSNGSLEEQGPVSRTNVMSDRAGGSFADRDASRRDAQRTLTASGPSSSMSSATLQTLPVPLPYSENPPTVSQMTASSNYQYPTPPPPPPKQDDALGALQRTGDLERRASRRFSEYHINKHLNAPSNGVPVLPSQNSSLPNRGRDVRESLNAVRLRGSYLNGKQRSTNPSPTRASQVPVAPSITEEGGNEPSKPRIEVTPGHSPDGSPIARTPADKLRPPVDHDSRTIPVVTPSQPDLRRPGGRSLAEGFEPEKGSVADAAATLESTSTQRKVASAFSTPPQSRQFIPDQSPSPGKELTLFLQYKSKIKKYILPDGSTGLTLGRLQLAFIEKFAWNTHHNGVDLPEIYIQDPISGVRHELEDLTDVKDRSVLVLNVEALDEVKKHIDDGLVGIRRLIEGVKGTLDQQENVMQRVSDRQQEAAKEMARLAAAPTVSIPVGSSKSIVTHPGSISSPDRQIAELQSLRRDLAVLRQTYSNFSSDIAASMNIIRSKAGSVKSIADDVSTPSYEGDAGRARITAGKKELADESERLVARVDDLQDLVEDLRKDVVTRGVRPLPRQLEAVSKDISVVTKELKKMQDFLRREKPIWTKIWEKELQLVCEERDQLTMQEDLAADLDDDLEKAAQTFALVEEATKQQNMENPSGAVVLRSTSRTLAIDQAVDPMKAKDNVLGEVRALQPNHESRLEAIERAEKARQKELEGRRDDLFQKELGQFVQEGKLKRSGGVEETERLRRTKDERIRKEVWERQQARLAELERLEMEGTQSPQLDSLPEEPLELVEPHSNSGHLTPDSAAADPSEQEGDEEGSSKGEHPAVQPASPSKRKSWLPSIFAG
ncbi:Actin interacting protein 3 domain containing protein [Elaphomyces granulatus]